MSDGYETLLVPALFQQWTTHVLDAAQVASGHRVLDVACGTGVLARDALARVGAAGKVAGVNPTEEMLAVAARVEPRISWTPGTAEELPFDDGDFDAVVSQFGMMFFADRALALHEMLRVLRPGGRIAVAVWDALEANPAYAGEVSLFAQMAGEAAAAAMRAPFCLGNRDELVRLFRDHDLTGVRAETHAGRARFDSIRTMVEADLRGWLPLLDVHLDEPTIGRVLDAADGALARHMLADGRGEFSLSAHVVTGSKR